MNNKKWRNIMLASPINNNFLNHIEDNPFRFEQFNNTKIFEGDHRYRQDCFNLYDKASISQRDDGYDS